MISRRNIRVKVMQTLYSLAWHSTFSSDDDGPGSNDTVPRGAAVAPAETVEQGRKLVKQHLEQTNREFVYLLYFLGETARYAETDARMRASRHLPTYADLHVNTRIAGNALLWRMWDDPAFKAFVDNDKIALLTDRELIKKTYLQLVDREEYRTYAARSDREETAERHILTYIFQELMLGSEAFDQHMEELFICWPDDKEMMSMLLQNYFHKPQQFNFLQLISLEKQTYAYGLMETAIEKRDYCLELIFPKLKNWEPDRIAAVDMLLMVMCVCEFLYFPTIPTKVSINEYIDLAKAYSTPQSGQFVNGILDNILKDLTAGEKIHKTAHVKK